MVGMMSHGGWHYESLLLFFQLTSGGHKYDEVERMKMELREMKWQT